MTITLNGKKEELVEGISVAELLKKKNIRPFLTYLVGLSIFRTERGDHLLILIHHLIIAIHFRCVSLRRFCLLCASQ